MKKTHTQFDFAFPFSIELMTINNLCPSAIWRDHLSICLCLKGSLSIVKSGTECTYSEGDLLLLNANSPALYSTDNNALLLAVTFDSNYYSKAFPLINSGLFIESLPDNESFMESLLSFTLTVAEGSTKDYSQLMEHSNKIISYLINNYVIVLSNTAGPSKDKRSPNNIALLRSLVEYIDRYYADPITLNSFASLQHLSPNYLSHVIKKETGQTFRNLLSFVRCVKSQQFLLNPTYRINELAYDVGFSQPLYYKNNFQLHFSVSPQEYRSFFQPYLKNNCCTINSNKDIIESQIKDFTHRNGYKLSVIKDTAFSAHDIDVSMHIRKFDNLLHDMGKIDNIRTEMTEDVHKAFDNVHKDFRVTLITIDSYNSLFKSTPSTFLSIAKNINYLIDSGFNVAFEINDLKESVLSAISDFLVFYSRLYYDSLHLLKILYRSDKKNEIDAMYRKKIMQSILEKSGLTIEVIISHDYVNTVRYIPEIYDSFLITPFAMDELFNTDHWKKEIDFSFIDDINPQGFTFGGGSGLLTWEGIKKPWWYAYLFVSKLRGYVVSQGTDHIITADNGRLSILTYNLCGKRPEFLETIHTKEMLQEVINSSHTRREHSFQIYGLHGKYKLTRQSIGESTCLFSRWADLGYIDYLTGEEEELISRTCHPDTDFQIVEINDVYNLIIVEMSFGVSFVQLEKIPDKEGLQP